MSEQPAYVPDPEGDDCVSCGESDDSFCDKAKRACRHHCNHSWTHDECCWCGTAWGEDGVIVTPGRAPL